MLIPDLKIYDIIKFFVAYTAADYANATDKTKTILHDLFAQDDGIITTPNNFITGATTVTKEMKLEKLKFLDTAVELFYTRDVEDPRQIQVSIGYALERQQLPHIHILLANKTKGKFDSIGLSQGEFAEIIDIPNQIVEYDKARSFSGSVALMVTGNMPAQVLTVQYFLEAMFDMFHEMISFTGILNHQLNTQDLQLYDQLAPKEIFSRVVLVSFDYQSQVHVRQFKKMASAFQMNLCTEIDVDYDNYVKGV